MSGKSPHIRRFLNDLVGGLACSMSRARLDAGKVGLVTDIRRLERSDIFEGMTRHHAIVRVGSGGQDRGIWLARLNVVIRRVFQEVAEIRLLCRRPKLAYPDFSSMSITPTWGSAAANKSGRWLTTAPTSKPPFEAP
jgi:hypothetical protein